MPMQLKCPNPACTTMLNVREEFAGKMIKCPTCAATLMVPQPAAAAAMAGVPTAPVMPTAAPMPSPGPSPDTAGTPIPPEMQGPAQTPLETFWALIDKNALDKKSQTLLAAGLGAMLFLLFSMILPRYSYYGAAEAFGTKVGEYSKMWLWIETLPGWFIILVTLMVIAFLAASFVKMHVFLRYGFFAATAWGGFLLMMLFLVMIIDAVSTPDVGSGMKLQTSIGIGTYFSILASLGIVGSFGLLSYPEVMKLINKQAKPLV